MSYSRSRTKELERSRHKSRFRRFFLLNVILLACIAAVAVWLLSGRGSSGGDAGPGPSTSAAPTASSLPSASASSDAAGEDSPPAEEETTPAPEPAKEGVTLAFVGDILPAARVAELMKKNGYDYPFRETSAILQAADITAGNLEAPITERGTPAEDKQYVFRGPVEALPAIKDAGFDVLNLANNHTLDYGWVGLQDTMDALDDHKLPHMGSGVDDKEAFTPVYIEANGLTVAYIGVSRVVPEVGWKAAKNHPGVADGYSPAGAAAAIQTARENADIIVVYVHWGIELSDTPDNFQKDLGHRLIDAGADLVIGSHPHVLQGFEAYKGKWIAYSLGNFVFNTSRNPLTSETGILMAQCGKDGACSLELKPMLAKNSQPAPMEASAGRALFARLSAVSTAAVVEENGRIVEKH